MRRLAPRFVLLLLFTFQCSLLLVARNPAPAPEASRPAKTSADQIWAKLAAGNKRFINGKTLSHNYVSQRHAVAKGQQPKVAVLSCSDSRVPPEILFDQGLGDLFVVRSAGNSADPLGIGSLEYAVEHLGSVVIVVLGHQNCGAVKAACSGEKMPSSISMRLCNQCYRLVLRPVNTERIPSILQFKITFAELRSLCSQIAQF